MVCHHIRALGWTLGLLFGAGAVHGCGGASTTTSPTTVPPIHVPSDISPALGEMLWQLEGYIFQALSANRDFLQRNLNGLTEAQAKIALLRQSGLAQTIIDSRRWAEGTARSIDGRAIPILAVFPEERMRQDAEAAVRSLEPVLPLLEQFFDRPLPSPVVRVWYGFVIGATGGGGVLFVEDQGTYESRTGPNRFVPYDAALGHELAHTYLSNEALTQFLELYTYNVVRTGLQTPMNWPFTRNWMAGSPTNQDAAALLDVYQLIGHENMARGYRALYPLKPPYGVPLSASVIDAFVEAIPAAFQTDVRAKLTKIAF